MTVPSEAEVLSWFDAVSNWGRWGADDELGTINLITPTKRAAAARLVQDGVTVSCAWDIDTRPKADHVFGPPHRFMVGVPESEPNPARRSSGAAEHIGLVYHGYTTTHIDGLSHIAWDGKLYNGRPGSAVNVGLGATVLSINTLALGVVTRGVLLDVAATREVDWLQPGDGAMPEDLAAAEAAQSVTVEEGDAVLLRTGYGRRVREDPSATQATGRAGWHASCIPWLHERGVAAIGCDTAQDVIPSGYPALRHPLHDIGIVAMGLWLVDNCDLEALRSACWDRNRWEFMFVLSPLRVVGGTGSPANPLAIF